MIGTHISNRVLRVEWEIESKSEQSAGWEEDVEGV
jgi:hypothetical protein